MARSRAQTIRGAAQAVMEGNDPRQLAQDELRRRGVLPDGEQGREGREGGRGRRSDAPGRTGWTRPTSPPPATRAAASTPS